MNGQDHVLIKEEEREISINELDSKAMKANEDAKNEKVKEEEVVVKEEGAEENARPEMVGFRAS